MSIYSGYLWELKKNYIKGWNEFCVQSVFWFDSEKHEKCLNEASTIFICEPIEGVTDITRNYVINNLNKLKKTNIIFYENDIWKLKLP